MIIIKQINNGLSPTSYYKQTGIFSFDLKNKLYKIIFNFFLLWTIIDFFKYFFNSQNMSYEVIVMANGFEDYGKIKK